MLIKISLSLVVLIAAFLAYVATRPDHFRYERSALINAPRERVFPYLSDLRLGGQWSTYERMDPDMTREFSGPDGLVGSKMTFASKKAGSGSIEILRLVPNEELDEKLLMTAPFRAENLVQYKLAAEGDATRLTWTMSGESAFVSKLFATIFNSEKMLGNHFADSAGNLNVVLKARD